MNKERLLKLADVIEAAEHFDQGKDFPLYGDSDFESITGFYMGSFCAIKACGTAGCIAGWALKLWPQEVASGLVYPARQVLGMNRNDAHYLFFGGSLRLEDITPQCAADCLRLVAGGTPVEEAWLEAAG